MIERRLLPELQLLLADYPAVALLGPRQVGKTTLALKVAETINSIYLDLESAADRSKLADPELYLVDHEASSLFSTKFIAYPNYFKVCAASSTADDAKGKGQGGSCCSDRRPWN